MIFQTSFRHVLIHQESVITIWAITNEFDKILVVKLAKVVNLCLQESNPSKYKQRGLEETWEYGLKHWQTYQPLLVALKTFWF